MQPLILATAMVSPFGMTPRDHAFFLRARVPSPPPSPFATDEDEVIKAIPCPLLPTALPTEGRLIALARMALADIGGALSRGHGAAAKVTATHLVTSPLRPGLTHDDVAGLEASVRHAHRAPIKRFTGEAGVFASLAAASQLLEAEPRGLVLVLAVDSFLSVDWLAHARAHPGSPWAPSRPHPSEAAAALVLAGPVFARELGLPPLARVVQSAVVPGAANDDNDEPVDPVAMTQVLTALGGFRVRYAFGQDAFDTLRVKEWYGAVARQAFRFREGHYEDCIERRIGQVGAASGAVSLVFGMASLRHRTIPMDAPANSPMVAWALSRDGMRGAAAVELVSR